jgi:PTS system mannose-specific IIA component
MLSNTGGVFMFPIIIVTHGNLAKEFVNALEHVMGPQDKVKAFCLHPKDDVDKKRKELLKLVKEQHSDNGVVVLTDMFGGTPSNLSISLLDLANVEVIAGVNLPMLIKLASQRGKVDLKTAVEEAQNAARRYINVASKLLDMPA